MGGQTVVGGGGVRPNACPIVLGAWGGGGYSLWMAIAL